MKSADEQTNENKKIFFFLRHNNDIDHIVPVIYKWLLQESIQTEVIITTNRKYLNDYRIKILKKFRYFLLVVIITSV
jgi:hypothetical protein